LSQYLAISSFNTYAHLSICLLPNISMKNFCKRTKLKLLIQISSIMINTPTLFKLNMHYRRELQKLTHLGLFLQELSTINVDICSSRT